MIAGYPPFENLDRGSMAYLGGTAAVYKKPEWVPGMPNLFGILGYFTWRSAYWSMQLTMKNRIQLGWSWLFNAAMGRDLTRFGKHSAPAARDLTRTESGREKPPMPALKNARAAKIQLDRSLSG